jgi:Actinobacteria/chloroflexi VLRF1 release factor
VPVGPERLAGWLARYAERHGDLMWTPDGDTVIGEAADGSALHIEVPFPPSSEGPLPDVLVQHALARRQVGVLLVRLGGWAAGVFDGERLISSKVDSRQVQGRTAAGGWSQQRFARRRAGQARVALADAISVAERVLLPVAATLDGVVTGGDRTALRTVLAADSLAPLQPLIAPRVLDVPDPRLRVLEGTPSQFRAIWIRITEFDERSGDE